MAYECGDFVKCLPCLNDGKIFVRMANRTACCLFNLATFDYDFTSVIKPGEEADCPADIVQSNGLVAAAAVLSGLGIALGACVGICAWLQGRRARIVPVPRLNYAEETTSLLSAREGTASINDVHLGRGAAPDIIEMQPIVPSLPQQQQQLALLPSRNRNSFAGLRSSPWQSEQDRTEDERDMARLALWLVETGTTVSKVKTSKETSEKLEFKPR